MKKDCNMYNIPNSLRCEVYGILQWTAIHLFYNNNNNNNNNKLQLGCHPVAVIILHVYKI